MDGPAGYAESYADAHLPPGGDVEDQHEPVGDGATWWEFWQAMHDAFEAGWERAMEHAREALR